MAIDTAGITRPAEVETSAGRYQANLVTVRTHAALADGRVVQLMPTNDARAELPPDATVIWHERMGKSPQDVALAGASPVDGSEITAKGQYLPLDEASLANRLAGAETELRRLKEAAGKRLHGDTLASIEAQIADLRKQAGVSAAPDKGDLEANPNMPTPDDTAVRTTAKPGPRA